MNVHIIMGTHLPEVSRCIDYLARDPAGTDPVEVHVPASRIWKVEDDRYAITGYDHGSVLWVLDPDGPGTCFIVIDPGFPLIPQLEKLAGDLGNCLVEPVKILTCVDCQRAGESTKLKGWLDACIYYSDVVLMGNRDTASKSFVRDFQKHYEKLCYPCLFLMLKGGGMPGNAGEILTPGTRRISQLFELPGKSAVQELPGVVIESSCDLDLQESEMDPFRSPGEDQSVTPVPDPSEFIVPQLEVIGKNP